MLKINIPRKKAALIQICVSIFLILLTFFMSLMPVINLKPSNSGESVAKMMSEFSNIKVDEDKMNTYDSIDVNVVSLVKGTKMVIDVISVSSDIKSGKDVDANKIAALESKLESNDEIKTVIVAATLIDTFTNVFEGDEGSNSSTVGAIFSLLIVICVILGIIGLTVVFPIILIALVIINVVSALLNFNRPELVAGKISGRLTLVLSLSLTLMLFQCLIPEMTYGLGVIAIIIIAMASVIFSTVMTRTISYNKQQLTYINIVQGTSAVGIVGFFLFFFGLLNTNVFLKFTSGGIFDYIAHLDLIKSTASNADIALPKGHWVDVVLMALYVIFALTSLSYLEKAARRLSCTSKSGDGLMAAVITTVPVFVIPTVLRFIKHRYAVTFESDVLKVDAANATSFLKLRASEFNALTLVLVGIIIMLAAEICLIVLKRSCCQNMDTIEMSSIVNGDLLEAAEKKEAPAEKPVEESGTDIDA